MSDDETPSMNKYYASWPPSEIFLVIEQKLTSSYYIEHSSSNSVEFELLPSEGAPLTAAGLMKCGTGTGIPAIRMAGSEDGPNQYSIFLDVYPSRRISDRIRRKSFRRKVDSMCR